MDQNTVRKMQALLNTEQGKALIRLLSADGGKAMNEASAALKAGNSDKVREIMSPMLQNSEAKALLTSLEKSMTDG